MSTEAVLSFPRVRQRFVVSASAVVGGIVGGAAVALLLAQFAVLFPTLLGLIVGAVIGLVVGVAAVNVVRRSAVARLNERITQAEALINSRAGQAPVPSGVMHQVPESGLAAYANPDSSVPPAGHLDAGLPVEVVERWGDWALIRCSNDWTAWVDGRGLQEVLS